ncbi:glycosyltransferase family 4 protein [Tolypothrix sp. PCC 7910]|uniref:glycosyltransferase family 4 protein n=1 Tax=Tolypothrix sp. PCC 7910 TaxID=2099387 RepID=UPI001FCBAAF8|nr:glycosyltransferase family 4 protein [Tolypothrix sp. PCC 7910]
MVEEFADVKFIWIGEGEQHKYLFKKLKECGLEDNVLFLGYRSDISRLLKAADIFVFPTHFEGLPFAPIEAMAHDPPIVASDASSIPELIEDKVHGLLFSVGNSN